jgi:hypothetical protein
VLVVSQLCFLFSVVVCYFLVFRPLFAEVDHMMKRSRALLLLLPEEVILGVSAIKTAVEKLANCQTD